VLYVEDVQTQAEEGESLDSDEARLQQAIEQEAEDEASRLTSGGDAPTTSVTKEESPVAPATSAPVSAPIIPAQAATAEPTAAPAGGVPETVEQAKVMAA